MLRWCTLTRIHRSRDAKTAVQFNIYSSASSLNVEGA